MTPWAAVLDPKRSLSLIDRQGRVLPGIAPEPLLWADWASAGSTGDPHSWPTWSPDAHRIAVFRQSVSTGDTQVFVTTTDGATAAVLATLDRRLPIHLEWSPTGDSLAVLCQQGSRLLLELLDAPEPGNRVPVASGSPLFYSWLDAQRLAVFIGHTEHPSELRIVGSKELVTLPGVPGNFCTPVSAGDELLYVAHRDQSIELLAADQSGSVRALEPVDGLMALVPSHDRRRVAYAVAEQDGSPYRGLTVLEPATGARIPLADEPLLAFFWSPRGDAVIGARQQEDSPRITWLRLGLDGSRLPLFEHLPTRDLAFWLRFFEQYCISHPIIDPSGDNLLVGGFEAERSGEPLLWRVPLDGSPAETIRPGVLAVCPRP